MQNNSDFNFLFLTKEDIEEIRIFRSRLIRLIEHDIECPDYFCQELVQMINETVRFQDINTDFEGLKYPMSPMILFCLINNINFKQKGLFNKFKFDKKDIKSLINIFII